MYKYAIVVLMALSSSAITPAWAGGHGCFGGRLRSLAGDGCYGGDMLVSYGCYGSGCYGSGMPVSYGCWGGGFAASSGCYGGVTAAHSGWSGSSCYGGIPAGYYSGRFGRNRAYYGGTEGISYAMPAPQADAIIPGERTPNRAAPRSNPGYDGDREPRVTNREVQERDRSDSGAGREAAAPNRATPAETAPPESIGAPEELANTPAPATIVVRLPVDATLSINEVATRSAAPTRTFVSPSLQPGKQFHYTLKAEAVRDGEKVTTTKRVAVRAGEKKEVVLELASAGVVRP